MGCGVSKADAPAASPAPPQGTRGRGSTSSNLRGVFDIRDNNNSNNNAHASAAPATLRQPTLEFATFAPLPISEEPPASNAPPSISPCGMPAPRRVTGGFPLQSRDGAVAIPVVSGSSHLSAQGHRAESPVSAAEDEQQADAPLRPPAWTPGDRSLELPPRRALSAIAPAPDTPRRGVTGAELRARSLDPGELAAASNAYYDDPVRERAHLLFGPVLPADDAALYRAGFAPTEVYELRRPSRRRPRAPPGWTHRIVPAAPHPPLRPRSSSSRAGGDRFAAESADTVSVGPDSGHRRRPKKKRFLLPEAAVSIETQATVSAYLDDAMSAFSLSMGAGGCDSGRA